MLYQHAYNSNTFSYSQQKRRREDRLTFKNRLEYLAILFLLQFGDTNFIVTATKCAKYQGSTYV